MVRPAGAVHHEWVEDVPFTLHWPYWLDQALADCSPMSMEKNTGSIYDCTVNDVITSYMHTITISSHQRYSRMIKGAHSLRSNK